MNSTSEYILNDHIHYHIKIPSFRHYRDHILYQAEVFDSTFMFQYTFYFRFKTLKQINEQLRKKAVG